LVLNEPVLALKLDVVAPAGTVTEGGTVNRLLLLCNLTADPFGLAADLSWTVQLTEAFCPGVAGLQATPETSTGARRLIAAVCELLPKVAVTVAV
jgi:hypothetical protein